MTPRRAIVLMLAVWLGGFSAIYAIRADGPAKPLAPISVAAPEQKPILDAYQAVVLANKDLQIAILRARVVCKVGEDWSLNLQTMQFEPPAAPGKPSEKPKP